MACGDAWIHVRGARTHNLHSVNLDLPLGSICVLTGPSGSGKSSLAFDTIYAEGQRRYLETLAAGSRALFDQLQRPDVDLVDNLPPCLCVSQHVVQARPRSTLATVTDIHNLMRLLWARLGTPHCHQCGKAIHKHTLAEVVRATLKLDEGRKVYLLAPLVECEAGEHREAFLHIKQGGYLRARVDGVLCEIRDIPKLNPKKPHTIELVVDRLVIRPGIEERLIESLGTAVKHGSGRVIVTDIDDGDWRDQAFSTSLSCPKCRIVFPELEPRLFHFNNPHGACPRCTGFGQISVSQPETIVREAEDDEEIEELRSVTDFIPCPECGGARLRREARAVRFAGKGLHEVTALTVDQALVFFNNTVQPTSRPDGLERVQHRLVEEISQRLRFLVEVGLGYLTLDRPAPTLSGGEAQRARLASYLGGGLLGVCYILDEPTIGLHPRDTERLIRAMRGLCKRGNTLVVVEHDEAVMRHADYLVDMGPGAGPHGGLVLASGSFDEVVNSSASVTAPYLCQKPSRLHASEVSLRDARSLTIQGARHHNLKNLTVHIPLGCLVCLTGVSGAGKSSLARDILCHAARRHFGLAAPLPGEHDKIDGLEHLDKVLQVDQKPPGRSSRSCAASYTGLFDEIRKVFAATRAAKMRGYKASRFSFNVKGGRCEECQGQGSRLVSLQFLPDLTVPCSSCQGRRFSPSTLEVLFRGKSIADVLAMPVELALELFANIPAIHRPLTALADVGLGYLALGQPSSTLSGGESQRVKLAAELCKPSTGKTLYLLDEPTTGLHFADVENLVRVLKKLVANGNTVLVSEHNMGLISEADWIIDLGPEGGEAGGYLVAAGMPDEIMKCASSMTGQALTRRGE